MNGRDMRRKTAAPLLGAGLPSPPQNPADDLQYELHN